MSREAQLANLNRDVEEVIGVYEQKSGVPASRTWPMIQEHGHVEALSKLVCSADLQQGFKVLRDSGALDMTFEALVVRYRDFFRDPVVEAAEWRLMHADDLLSRREKRCL